MAHRAVRVGAAAMGVLAASFALGAPAAFAKGPAPKVSASASSSCAVTGTVSWKKLMATSIEWTLYENGTPIGSGSTSGGVLPSPQSTTFTLTTSTSTNAFFVTAELKMGADQVGPLGTSRTINANCAPLA